jgi:alkanesulfonate monooxygenase SsuD/methylene tetrahydromethanopterin reductase-like flavin-dependent oxidoreductase (luciferase family)
MVENDVTIGLRVPRELFANREGLQEFVERADDSSLDRLCVGDHVSFHGGTGYDGLIQSTALAALSSRIEIMTAIYLLPLRHPVLVARQVASLAEMASGRFVFGIGIGGEDPHESEVCGVDPRTRGRRADESLALIRGLLQGEEVDFHGEHYEVERARILPAPSPPVSVIVGGRSEAALRRAARSSEGWLGIWQTPERYAESIASVQAFASELNRADDCSRHGYLAWCSFGDDAAAARPQLARAMESLYKIPFDRFERYCPHGTPAEIAKALRPYVAAGARDINLIAPGADHAETVTATLEVRRLLRGDAPDYR